MSGVNPSVLVQSDALDPVSSRMRPENTSEGKMAMRIRDKHYQNPCSVASFEKNSSVYIVQQSYLTPHGRKNGKRQEDKLEDKAKRIVGFKRSAKTLLARNDDRAYEVFKALLIDACKKRRETEQKLRLAVAEQQQDNAIAGSHILHSLICTKRNAWDRPL
ncbi:hypothetical protein BDZ91DRAFT_811278 [Kalaharituber pfeilii]|nr:hypothetical protein BDZ91DRAFT_811278 [Kalaharituber pfeilii]